MTAATTLADQFYSPGRLKTLLWQYKDLVQLCRGVATAEDASSQHLPRETPEGGFETGAVLKADIDSGLAQLEPIVRRVVIDYYVRGYAAVEIAAMLPGCNRWFVDRARHRGVRQMAKALKWLPPPLNADGTRRIDDDDETNPTFASMRERVRMIVHRAFDRCPEHGPPGYACPVIGCLGWFDALDGTHCTEGEAAAA